ncbi:unnamed protein product, partial [Ectocarpus sp. 12 AP-2014]
DGEPEGGEDDGYLATFVSRKDGTGNSGLVRLGARGFLSRSLRRGFPVPDDYK